MKVRSYEELFSRSNIIANPTVTDLDAITRSKWTIFCDGSWCKLTRNGGFAATAMKDDVIVACRIGWMSSCISLLEAEIRGAIVGLEIARELNFQEVYIV